MGKGMKFIFGTSNHFLYNHYHSVRKWLLRRKREQLMKRRLLIMNEKGFFLPYVLIVAVIMLTIITTSILIYKTEVESTQFFIDQLELETIIQMGRAQFKAEEVYKN